MSRTREEIKAHNRNRILDAGLEVFANIGFQTSTIRDIVRASGLAIGTFYNYFKEKDDILAEILHNEVEQIRAKLRATRANARNVEELIYNAYLAYFEIFSRRPLVLEMIARNTDAIRAAIFISERKDSLARDLEEDLQAAIDRGILPEVPVKYVTWVMIGTGLEYLTQMASNPELKPEALSRFLTRLFLKGLDGIQEHDPGL